jgi:hypothetical protein
MVEKRDYLRPEDVDLTEEQHPETLLWLKNRNRHDLLEEYEKNMNAKLSEELKEPTPPVETGPGGQTVVDSPDDDYDEWKVDELKAELDSRLDDASPEEKGRLTYGRDDKKADLIAKLRADDRAAEA